MLFNHYCVWTIFNGNEIIIKSGLTYDEACNFVDNCKSECWVNSTL